MSEKEMTAPYLLAQIRSSHPKTLLIIVSPILTQISRVVTKCREKFCE